MKKRIAVLALAVLLAVTVSPAAQAAPDRGSPFADLQEDHWSYEYVASLYEQGVVNGYPDGTFRPTGSVTWGESFKLMLLAMDCEEPERDPEQHWAYPYIQLALDNRLVYDYNESTLDEVPTRLHVARMAARGLGLTDISGESPYTDCDDGYVVELFEKGIMDGFIEDDGTRTFRPEQPISREQMSAIICRMMEADFTQIPGMFLYGNYWLDELDSVAASPFTPEQFQQDERGRLSWTGGYYVHGIDVSGHKGEIDWAAVAEDGIDFAIVRAGNRFYGKNGSGAVAEDSYFERNMQGAIDAGLDVGAYFFSNAITVEEALEEADLLLSKLEPYRQYVTYPVVCDWEFLGGKESRAYGVDAKVITECIAAFCQRVEEAGYQPMIYFNKYCGYVKMDLSKLTRYPFWYAEYTDYGQVPSCRYAFQMWQYSSKGQVAGINSSVDMNLCFVPYPEGAALYPNAVPAADPAPEDSGPVPSESQPSESEPAPEQTWPPLYPM